MEPGKAIPCGVCDVIGKVGWVNVGAGSDAVAFVVESIRRRRRHLGKERCPEDRRLPAADCGGSNGNRVRLWTAELQKLARDSGIGTGACCPPPGTSKRNRTEHRLFSSISRNRRGKSLYSLAAIIGLIGSATTGTGLKTCCDRDTNDCPTGIGTGKSEIEALEIRRTDFHGDWNRTLLPVPDYAVGYVVTKP